MKKHLFRMFALLLICAVFSSAALPAMAAEISENPNAVQRISTRAAGQVSGLPFTMRPGVNITGLWTTNRTSGGYNFVPGNVDTGTTITIKGSFKHSDSKGECKAGVCLPSGGSYSAKLFKTKSAGSSFDNDLGALSALDGDTTYYGFVKKESGSGYVHSANITIGIK